MKRILVFGLCFLLIFVTCIAGCSSPNDGEQDITYLIDFPVLNEPPEDRGVSFSPQLTSAS